MTQTRSLWKRCMFLICFISASCLPISCTRQPSAQTMPTSAHTSMPKLTVIKATPQPLETPVNFIPTSLPTMGTVKGTLLDQATGEPAPDQILYLAKLLKPAGSEFKMAALNPTIDPRAYTDEEGRFTFINIPPDTYALGLATPLGPMLIQVDGHEIIFTIEGGETVDLGLIYVHFEF